MELPIILLILGLSLTAFATPQISPAIYNDFKTQSTVNILVSFKDNKLEATRAQVRTFGAKARGQDSVQLLYEALKANADSTQAEVMRAVDVQRGSRFYSKLSTKQLWVSNQLIIQNADRELLGRLGGMEGIASIEPDRIIPLLNPVDDKKVLLVNVRTQSGIQHGVEQIQAPQLWAQGYNGTGVVVANIDTGVSATHEALQDGFRADYGWYDAVSQSPVPIDDSGHGTHTMGTIVGKKNGIGVAPGAKWIACRACDVSGCSLLALLTCGQWILCPTDPYGENDDCSKRPKIVSNSWGGGQELDFYDTILDAWAIAEITPFFAAGNEGSQCGTILSPADSTRVNALSVGAVDESNTVAYFSSVGPTYDGRVRPDVAAPGTNVLSASHLSNNGYALNSGTSMACPHAAGLAALLLSKNPNAGWNDIRVALHRGAVPTNTGGNHVKQNCGNVDEDVYPNNHVGWGIISATSAAALV